MQAQQVIEACKAIYGSALPPQTKLETIGTFLGGVGVIATKPARNAMPARTGRTTTATAAPAARTRAATPARTRGRKPAAAKPLTQFQQQVLNLIPLTGGIPQTSITIPGKRANNIGTALSGLKKAGRLVEQNGVWFRETPAAQAA